MKKTIMILIICILLSICGCSRVNEIENKRLITGCLVTKQNNDIIYNFYVSVPSGNEGGEDSGSKSAAKLYEYHARDFSDALSKFEDSGVEKIDISHMSLFAGNKEYFDDKFYDDEEHIRQRISATSLIYVCIADDSKKLAECINVEYDSKAQEFAKNILDSSSTEFNCMMTNLSLSVHNANFTAAIPVVELKKHGDNLLPEITGVSFYVNKSIPLSLDEHEFEEYNNWRKNARNESDGYKLSVKNNNLIVHLKDKDLYTLASRYLKQEVDILNCTYYAKKCFTTYDSYNKFISNLKKSDIIVV